MFQGAKIFQIFWLNYFLKSIYETPILEHSAICLAVGLYNPPPPLDHKGFMNTYKGQFQKNKKLMEISIQLTGWVLDVRVFH